MSLDNNPENNIGTKLNHSGNAPETTEAVGSWAPSTETTPSTVEEKGFTKKQKLIATMSGAVLALGIGVGLKSMNNNDGEQIAPVGPVATAPANVNTERATPTASETTKPVEAKTSFETFMASFDISAEKYTTPQAITAAYYERYNNWINAGLTIQPDRSLISDNPTTISNVEAKFDSGITSRLFTTSETATSLITSIDGLRRGTILNYLMSQDRGDAVPYVSSDELMGVKLAYTDNPDLTKATAFGVNAEVHASDNRDQNIAPYFKEHNGFVTLEIDRKDDINFVRDQATNTWKVDSSYLRSSVDHSQH